MPAIFYVGFNILNLVVDGYSENKKKLRQAIAIELDYEEYIAIFHNGRGILAQGPIPLGILGYLEGAKGLNSYVYEWFYRKLLRRSLDKIKQLLAEAGYPGGRNFKTGN
ncbi:ABC transporter substrate-binding protein [Candidatus Coxiella mudrowiae]|uniref:ABC transporter substrate-binding protein n=1 Tax=Candidatus Coxiella mudrowiae TaxID=2054173 RepID=UPI001F1E32A8|nr:ABC transporter substrate-binding protein [Candidatus Coxiella mudrowiae]